MDPSGRILKRRLWMHSDVCVMRVWMTRKLRVYYLKIFDLMQLPPFNCYKAPVWFFLDGTWRCIKWWFLKVHSISPTCPTIVLAWGFPAVGDSYYTTTIHRIIYLVLQRCLISCSYTGYLYGAEKETREGTIVRYEISFMDTCRAPFEY